MWTAAQKPLGYSCAAVLFLTNFTGLSDCLRCPLDNGKLLIVHAVERSINMFPLFTPGILRIWIEKSIHGNVQQSDKLVKGVQAGVLAPVFNIHNGARGTVYKLGEVFLCSTLFLSLALDLPAQGVKVKPSGVLVHSHITPNSFYISGENMRTKLNFIF